MIFKPRKVIKSQNLNLDNLSTTDTDPKINEESESSIDYSTIVPKNSKVEGSSNPILRSVVDFIQYWWQALSIVSAVSIGIFFLTSLNADVALSKSNLKLNNQKLHQIDIKFSEANKDIKQIDIEIKENQQRINFLNSELRRLEIKQVKLEAIQQVVNAK